MRKLLVSSFVLVGIAGCGGSSSAPNDKDPNPPVATTPTTVTDISRNGYSALNYDPTNPNNLDSLPVPASPGEERTWVESIDMSDDFSYDFSSTSRTDFGSKADGGNKWVNFYHAEWDGPGATYWKPDHVATTGGKLEFSVSRNSSTSKENRLGVNAGCISSLDQVQYPVYVEASVSLADISLASAFWLLSPDDTQEIDVMEMYAGSGDDGRNGYFSKLVHLSHHSFIRTPFTDYQPKDKNSWWESSIDGFQSWGEYSYNGGTRNYMQFGVYWVNPYHFEYYINGELVRVVYDKAFATKMYGEWTYTYPKVDSQRKLTFTNGYQDVEQYAQNSDDFEFKLLEEASQKSPISVIDPYDYQSGEGFHKPADIIINMELQSWWVNEAPTDQELADSSGKNTMLVDWVRVYKPKVD